MLRYENKTKPHHNNSHFVHSRTNTIFVGVLIIGTMADKGYKFIQGVNAIAFSDLDEDKEMEISIKSNYEFSNSIYLDKNQIIELKKHLEYLLNQ